ncbi:invasion associated locus B family protein [Salinarimonas rosea]|uniref:invasion associated locus B family protein n=1 Tax=Salinarimonas rosea TaxID=552063 RepID=UPI00040BAA07|nr:invasion associated locus B family protein [Salinarimonas rosea]
MSFPARIARKRGLGFVTALAVAAGALAPLAASAQTAPAPAPAPQAPQPGQPNVVPVVPEPSQTGWTKLCGQDQASGAEICYTTRDFVSDQGQPVLAVAIYDIDAPEGQEDQLVARFLMPLGLLLQPGIRFAADQNAATNGAYAVCFPNGCFAEAQITQQMVDQMKAGANLNISVQNQNAQVVTFQVPLTGFTAGWDGDPIDPAELEAQQRRLQEELQRRSEELRQRLEQESGAAAPQ